MLELEDDGGRGLTESTEDTESFFGEGDLAGKTGSGGVVNDGRIAELSLGELDQSSSLTGGKWKRSMAGFVSPPGPGHTKEPDR